VHRQMRALRVRMTLVGMNSLTEYDHTSKRRRA
jgi:hypothetical protein